jgi:hypothetical protein
MARKKQSNPKRSKGKQEAFVCRKQKWFPFKTKPLKDRTTEESAILAKCVNAKYKICLLIRHWRNNSKPTIKKWRTSCSCKVHVSGTSSRRTWKGCLKGAPSQVKIEFRKQSKHSQLGDFVALASASGVSTDTINDNNTGSFSFD